MKIFFTLLLTVICVFLQAQNANTRTGDVFGFATSTAVKILKTYPNPATTYITFEFQRSYTAGLSIEIFDLPGKKVASAGNLQSSTTVQLQNFYRGVYIYKLLDKNRKVLESGKIQIVK